MISTFITAIFWQEVVNAEISPSPQKEPTSEFRIKNPQYVYKTKNVQMELNKEFWKKYAKKRIFRGSKKNINPPLKEKVIEDKKTTLIIAPHPDDEILCCANTISKKIAEGQNVKIIYVTNGGAHSKDDNILSQEYARRRRAESSVAALRLGLSIDDLFFLEFPDGFLDKLSSKPLRSEFTNQNSTPRTAFFPNAKYTDYNLEAALKTIITKTSPDEIYLPSVEDAHPDHQAVGIVVKNILQNNQELTASGFEYLVHTQTNECGETAHLKNANTKKLSLIRLFTSQFHTRQHKNFLEQFAALPEIFEEILQKFAKK